MDFNCVGKIAAEIKSAALLFSCGKDSIVCLDLMAKAKIKLKAVYFYMVPDLSIRNDIIALYEKRYGIEILQYPHPNILDFVREGKKLNFGNAEKYARKETGEYWLISGVRSKDSFFRRGMLKEAVDGIDYKYKKVYPIKDWSDKDVLYYINKDKLPLPVDYRYNVKHEFNKPTIEFLNFLKHNYPEDYRKTLEYFPFLEIKIKREAFYGS